MLHWPTGISQYAPVCKESVCQVLEGTYKIITLHSAQILY